MTDNEAIAAESNGGDDEERLVSHTSSIIEEEHVGMERVLPISETNVPRVACALLASITTGGVAYAFGLYGNTLKRDLHLSQNQLETISSATFVAGLFSWIPGILVDRFGTRIGISFGGFAAALSLMSYWFIAKQYVQIANTSVVVAILSSLGVAIFLSCALVTGSVFKIISCSCGAGNKGSAVGVAKGYVGLGSGAYACLFQSIRQPSTSDLDFLPMCAFFLIVAAVIPSCLALPNKSGEAISVPDVLTPLHFRLLYGSLLILATLIIGSSLMELSDKGNEAASTPNYLLAAVLIIVWIFPLGLQSFLPQKGILELDSADTEHYALISTSPSVESPSTGDDAEDFEDEEDSRSSAAFQSLANARSRAAETDMGSLQDDSDGEVDTVEQRRNQRLDQMLQTPTAWLMLWTGTILVGGGIVETNNLGQMVESLRFPPIVTSASLSLFSVAQATGRVATGAISESALNWNTKRCCIGKGVPRPFFLAAASLAGVIAHTILAIGSGLQSFIIGIAISGLAFGSVWPLMVLIVGEIYGTAHLAQNYMFYDGFTSAAGAFLLSKVVAQEVYDSHIDSIQASLFGENEETCYGQKCFQLTHAIIAVLSMTCIFTSFLTQHLSRGTYMKLSRQ